MFRFSKRVLFHLLAIIVLSLPAVGYVASAQQADRPWREVRTIEMQDYGLTNLEGLTFSPDANAFLLLKADGSTAGIGMNEVPVDTQGLVVPAEDPQNVAFNGRTNKLFVLGSADTQLEEIPVDGAGLPAPQAPGAREHNLDAVNLQSARGITFDPATGRLFVLHADGNQVVVITPDASFNYTPGPGRVAQISLGGLGAIDLQSIAFNPQNNNLYFLDAGDQRLYEVTPSGSKVSEFDLSSLSLANPKNIVFAPSGDQTDDPNNQGLFILSDSPVSASPSPSSPQAASAGEQLVELSLVAPAAIPGGVPMLPASLVQVVNMNNTVWNPSSPDPSGIDYWPAMGRFLTTDSEVEEMPPYWDGKNVFSATTSGNLVSTCTTYTAGIGKVNGAWNHYSAEPTGMAINPNTNRIYISDDGGGGKLFEISFGPDGNYCTSDDVVVEIQIATDLEDVAYGENTLFIAGGVDAEVWQFNLGPNHVIGGGDDSAITHFDTAAWGFNDLEGIGFNADAGTILLASSQGSEAYIGEASPAGVLLRAYNVSFMGGSGNLRSDIAYAPSSSNPAVKHFYIVSRGIDNGANPNENDGKWWEIAPGEGSSVTVTPSRTPTPTRTPTLTPTSTPSRTPTPTRTPTLVPNAISGDTTGVFRPSNGLLYLKNKNDTGFADIALNYGLPGDYPVVGDWDGNGTTTIGIYRNGTFYLRNSNTVGFAEIVFAFGAPGDQPIAGDWDGDGDDTIGVYRPSNGQFFLRYSNDAGPAQTSFFLGNAGDVGIAGDWDGDGFDTTGVFRPSNGMIFLKNTNTTGFADAALNYGIPGDRPVTGDWDSNGTDTIGVYRNGIFYLRNSNTNGFAEIVFGLGNPGDMPIAGNWDGLP